MGNTCFSSERAPARSPPKYFLLLGTFPRFLYFVPPAAALLSLSLGASQSGKTTFARHCQLLYNAFENKNARALQGRHIRRALEAYFQSMVRGDISIETVAHNVFPTKGGPSDGCGGCRREGAAVDASSLRARLDIWAHPRGSETSLSALYRLFLFGFR